MGFTSVEADVWLIDGELRVAHDLEDAVPGRTLESLYLNRWPNGCGRITGTCTSDGPATSSC